MKNLYVIDMMACIHRYYLARMSVGYIPEYNGKSCATLDAMLSFPYACSRAKGDKIGKNDKIVIAHDSRLSFRKEIDENYKANRPKGGVLEDTAFEQIEEGIYILEKHGIPVIKKEYFEADDVIGTVVSKYKYDFDNVYIASGDKDFYHLVDDKVSMVDFNQKSEIITKENWEDIVCQKLKCLVPYPLSTYVLTLLGDKADNVPKKSGFGHRAYEKLMGTILHDYEPKEMIGKELHILKDYVDGEHYEIIKKAHELTKLKEIYNLDIDFSQKIDWEGLKEVFNEYGVKSVNCIE